MAKKAVETPLMQQYYRIKEQHPDAILLFRVGDFYETFSDDAIAAASILGITLTKRANGAAQYVELAGFPYHALDNYLPRLVKAGRRVAICDQLEDPKMTKKLVKRGITELVTPGVVLGDNVLTNKENNYLSAVTFSTDHQRAGLSLLDISTGEFLCSEGTVDHIEKLIESYQPKELLIERKNRSLTERLLSYRGFVYELDDWSFAPESATSRLLKHFDLPNFKGLGLEHLTYGLYASGAILSYLELTAHTRLTHITGLRSVDRSAFMRLDAFTLRSLELLQPNNLSEGKSLLDIIDQTKTPMGGRLLRRWLTFPLLEIPAIEARQRVVQTIVEHKPLKEELLQLLSGIGDLERLASKLAVGRIGPREMNQLRLSLLSVERIKELAKGYTGIEDILRGTDSCQDLCQEIGRTLLEDAPLALGRGKSIAGGINAELDELRRLATGGKEYLVELQQRESERTGITSLKIAFNNVFGYYIEVRNTHKDRVPADWIRKQTLVNAERYIIPELKDYEEKILGAEERIALLESELFGALVERACRDILLIQRCSQVIASLDCLYSFAEVAIKQHYICPTLDNSSIIDIQGGRHPVIETQLPLGESYIPNDVLLDSEDTQIMVITGPNMSGKSALLRQTALIVLLAQVGSFVPAKAARIGIIDSIFTRVGASDNISRGESTFMVEMQEASSILNNLSPRSLILFDELGRGTSTYDGISIAWSIVEYLHDNPHGRPKTLFATHYHELNDLEERLERVKNYNVSAREHEGRMLFLRKLQRGGSEHSYGIQVARLGGMPRSIIERAGRILHDLESAHSSTIDSSSVAQQVGAKAVSDINGIPKNLTGVQLSIFQLDDPVLTQVRDALLGINIDELTPLNALNKLHEIKSLLKY